ncbi:hypothetical protein ABTL11_20985, partial [Acinetobacter baumannii]
IIGPLQYANTKDRGYMVITATPQECRAEWHYVSTITSRSYGTFNGPVWRTLPGAGARRLVAG